MLNEDSSKIRQHHTYMVLFLDSEILRVKGLYERSQHSSEKFPDYSMLLKKLKSTRESVGKLAVLIHNNDGFSKPL